MLERKMNPTTVSQLMKALNSCKTQETSLVGVYFDSAFMSDQILAEPMITFTKGKASVYQALITVKPTKEDTENIDRMKQYLAVSGMGAVMDRPEPELDTAKIKAGLNPFSAYLLQQTPFSDIQNYEMLMTFVEPVVTKATYKLNNLPYHHYAVTAPINHEIGDGLMHTLHLLFKPKTSDGENFFSHLVNKELNKADARKVLSTIADKNITGLFIGGVDVDREGSGTRTNLWAFTGIDLHEIQSDEGIQNFVFGFIEGGLAINANKIVGMNVSRTNDYKYKLATNMKDGTVITIYIG